MMCGCEIHIVEIIESDSKCKRGQSSVKRSGFTLIELMIALSILGMMMALVTASFYASTRAKRRAEQRMELIAMGRWALTTMIKEINGALIDEKDSSKCPFYGEPDGSFEAPQDMLYFTTASFDPRQFGVGSNIAEIEYRVEENPDLENTFFLQRRADPFPDMDPNEGGIMYDLAEEITGVRIKYQDENETWNNRWDSSSSKTLPRMVEITLHLRGKDGAVVQLKGIAAPMNWKPSQVTF